MPLYTSPGDSSWNAVIAAKKAHPTVGVVAIVNPSNGPGSAVSSAYTSGIAGLTAAGIKVIGYVATGYTRQQRRHREGEHRSVEAFYPGLISGIFFDEQSNAAQFVSYYRDSVAVHEGPGPAVHRRQSGHRHRRSYVGALDMMLIYESAGLPSLTALGGWHAKYAPSNFGIIPYAGELDATFVRNARQYVGTSTCRATTCPIRGTACRSYFADLLAALE